MICWEAEVESSADTTPEATTDPAITNAADAANDLNEIIFKLLRIWMGSCSAAAITV